MLQSIYFRIERTPCVGALIYCFQKLDHTRDKMEHVHCMSSLILTGLLLLLNDLHPENER